MLRSWKAFCLSLIIMSSFSPSGFSLQGDEQTGRKEALIQIQLINGAGQWETAFALNRQDIKNVFVRKREHRDRINYEVVIFMVERYWEAWMDLAAGNLKTRNRILLAGEVAEEPPPPLGLMPTSDGRITIQCFIESRDDAEKVARRIGLPVTFQDVADEDRRGEKEYRRKNASGWEEYTDKAESYVRAGKLDEAMVEIEKAMKVSPDTAPVYFFRGLIHGKKKDIEKAISDFDKAIELDPHFPSFYGVRGYAYFLRNDLDKAIADYSKALTNSLFDAQIYYARSLAYRKKGDIENADADLGRVTQIDPEFAKQPKPLSF